MNDQNESPFGNPRFLSAIVLVFLFLWGWQYYVGKKYPPAPANVVKTQDTLTTGIQPVEKTPTTTSAQTATGAVLTANNGKNALAEEKTFSYEDDQVKWTLSSVGMGLTSFQLKKYTDKEKQPIIYSSNDKLFSVFTANHPIPFEVQQVSEVEYVGKAMVNGLSVTRTLKYNKETLHFQSSMEFPVGLNEVTFAMADKKQPAKSGGFLTPSFGKQDFLYYSDKTHTEHINSVKDGESLNITANQIQMASINAQYFTEALVDKSEITPSIKMLVQGAEAFLNVNYDLKNTQVKKLDQLLYIGPKNPDNLKQIDPVLPEVMDYGMFGFISRPLLMLMRIMHDILGNWGLAIIALTLVVRLVMLPFNVMSFKSSRAMQRIQPQLQIIREKYKNDPMAVNRETMALMKQNKANPLSGCLPMLIQIPIFFALWRTIGSSIEIYQQPFFGWITDLSSRDHYFVLPVLMGITMFFQQRLTPSTMDPAQQKILNFMPILFAVFMLSLPSGLTLYNFISALFGVVQQYFLLKDKSKSAVKAA